jgi:hypothetical protein
LQWQAFSLGAQSESISLAFKDKRKDTYNAAGHQWPMPIILATWKTEMRRIEVWGQLGQIILKIPFQTNQSKMGRRCGKVPAFKSEALSSNSDSTKKKKDICNSV